MWCQWHSLCHTFLNASPDVHIARGACCSASICLMGAGNRDACGKTDAEVVTNTRCRRQGAAHVHDKLHI